MNHKTQRDYGGTQKDARCMRLILPRWSLGGKQAARHRLATNKTSLPVPPWARLLAVSFPLGL